MATATSSSPLTFPAMQGYELATMESSPPFSRKRRNRLRSKLVNAAGIAVTLLVTSLATAGLTVLFLRLEARTSNTDADGPISRSAAAAETEAACDDRSDLIGSRDRVKSSALDRLFDSMILDIRIQRIARLSHAAGEALTTVANASRPAPALALRVTRLRDPRLLAAQSHDSNSLVPLLLDRSYLNEMAGHLGAIAAALREQKGRHSKDRVALRRAAVAVEAALCQTRCVQRDLLAMAPPVADEHPVFSVKAAERREKGRAAPDDLKLLERPAVRLHVLCRDAARILRSHEALCAAFVELDARLAVKKAADGNGKDRVI